MRFIRFVSVFLVVVMCLTISASAANVGGKSITSAGAIVIDYATGDTLYAHNADVGRAPASISKMMTVYLVYEAIAKGSISPNTIVPISSTAYALSRTAGLTNVVLNYNANYTVDELLNATIVVSACGAALALAEFIGGTEANFVNMMNSKAAEWGINAVFTSSYAGVAMSVTPRAMATLTRYSIMHYPEILNKSAMRSTVFRGRSYASTNQLLGVYSGIDGFKTGTNSVAGENFIETAKRGETRIITVTMGSRTGYRFKDTTALLDFGFAEVVRRTPKHPAFGDVLATASYYNALDWAYNKQIFLGSGGKFNPNGAMTRGDFCLVLYRMAGRPEPKTTGGAFKDMRNTAHSQYKAITWANENGILLGSGGKCNPKNAVTRGQMATMLFRYHKNVVGGSTDGNPTALSKYSDRGGMSSAAAEHMRWVVTHGIIKGSGDKLNWRGKATREAAVIVLYRYSLIDW